MDRSADEEVASPLEAEARSFPCRLSLINHYPRVWWDRARPGRRDAFEKLLDDLEAAKELPCRLRARTTGSAVRSRLRLCCGRVPHRPGSGREDCTG